MATNTALHRLTSAKLKHGLEAHRRYSDGGGLWLQVSKSGTRSWIFRYVIGGRVRWHGLGAYPDVTLKEARERAADLRKLVRDGVDLIVEKRAEKLRGVSFKAFATDYIKAQSPGWKNPKHRQQWTNTLTTYAYPVIGDLPIDSLDQSHILKILRPIWNGKTETANRIRSRIENILDAAKVEGLRTGENPARWRANLKHVLPKRADVAPVKNHPAMPYADVPQFMAELRIKNSTSARALEFTVLTAVRTSATIGAVWDEFDFDAKLWTVPAERADVKITDGKPRFVPLCKRALEILDSFRERTDDSPYVFPGGKLRYPLSNMAMLNLLHDMRSDFTVHGFRSSFKDWASECTRADNIVSEMALFHVVKDETERAYRRGVLLEKRRKLMRDWEGFCAQPPAKRDGVVTPFRKKERA
nr:site-specific integrase [Bradyrhizobium sp. G127]